MYNRSPFRDVPTIQLMGVATETKWDYSDKFGRWLHRVKSRPVLSQLSEDAIKRASKAESACDSQSQAPERTWATLVETELCHKEHRFASLVHFDEVDGRVDHLMEARRDMLSCVSAYVERPFK